MFFQVHQKLISHGVFSSSDSSPETAMMKHRFDNLLLDVGKSELDIESCGPITSPNSDEDITDTFLFSSWIDDLLGNTANENVDTSFGIEHSLLCSVEAGAPLRSIRPDKRCVAHPRQK